MGKLPRAAEDGRFQYKKALGQHFLYDEALLKELVALSGITGEDGVLEIGPGSGSMTKLLASTCRRVIALELDDALLPILRVSLAGQDNVTVVHGDALRADLLEIARPLGESFCVVANIPYYITSPLLGILLSGRLPIRRMSLLMQKEVADKLTAAPGTQGYGMLAVRAQYFCEPRMAKFVPAAAFTPPPKVDSAFVVMPVRLSPPVAVADEELFFRMASAAFFMRRKTMLNNLQSAFGLTRQEGLSLLAACGLDERIRGEDLSLQAFADLANAFQKP